MSLDAVLLTHSHKDHIAGMDDLKAYNYFQQRSMRIYADAPTENAIRREFYYAFADERYPGVPEFDVYRIPADAFTVGDITITPITVWHLKMPVLGFRFGKFTYITDANFIEDAEKEKIRGSEVMVVNALRRQKHISHYNLEEAIDLVKELNVPSGYLTHLSHQMGKHADVEKELPEGIHLAYDGLLLRFE
jgi:phosphoribosyl 1,2-cyclic phosphate phosphodiesterase